MSTPGTPKPPICRPPHAGSAQGVRTTGSSGDRLRVGTLHHWTFLVLACLVVMGAAALNVRNGQQVVVPFLNEPLPGTCTFLRVTGLPCPGCGLTRSFISVAHGHVAEAWRYNPAGILFFAIVLYQIPYRTWQIYRIRRGLGEHRWAHVDNWVLLGLCILLLLQWACVLLLRLG
ncbi:MAG: DUF2752 domain-containing protein [Pirellulaceae bacterium]